MLDRSAKIGITTRSKVKAGHLSCIDLWLRTRKSRDQDRNKQKSSPQETNPTYKDNFIMGNFDLQGHSTCLRIWTIGKDTVFPKDRKRSGLKNKTFLTQTYIFNTGTVELTGSKITITRVRILQLPTIDEHMNYLTGSNRLAT